MERLARLAGEDLPPPSAELVLIAAVALVVLKRAGRKERKAIADDLRQAISWQAEYTKVVPIRPPEQYEEVCLARARAEAWLQRALTAFEGGVG